MRKARPKISEERQKEFQLILQGADKQTRELVKKFDFFNSPVRNLAILAYTKALLDVFSFLDTKEESSAPRQSQRFE